MAASLGIVLDERFDVGRQIGMGAMGVVYEAFDRQSRHQVAVKVLRAKRGGGARRFEREGAILAELDHPAIVQYVTHGTSPEGQTYLVMEWLEGQTLEERLQSGPLTVAEALTLARRVIDGLAVAHRRGIVHRDLKPSNLFLPGGIIADAKILDFGIAWRAWDRDRLTQAGAIVGTPFYMSPEQARGADHVDERSDLYSLGALLFECLAGDPPLMASDLTAVLCKICLEEPPRLRTRAPDAPMALDVLIASLLAKDPASRPRDALAVATALSSMGGSTMSMLLSAPPRVSLTSGAQRVLCAIFVRAPSYELAELGA
jgi:serine/threonine protein kinase